jgi:plasmid stabilization system protein ParE
VRKFALRRLPIVAFDIAEAEEWYEEQNPGAGLPEAFDREVEAAVLSLAEHALHHRIRFHDVRRAPLSRFAFYGIYYVAREAEVTVIAVFDDRRHRQRLRARRREVGGQL